MPIFRGAKVSRLGNIGGRCAHVGAHTESVFSDMLVIANAVTKPLNARFRRIGVGIFGTSIREWAIANSSHANGVPSENDKGGKKGRELHGLFLSWLLF